ncbi:MAG TPA: hypothetical protein VM388_05405, partial [Acidimicrobiales bacterium]|nr:hypothetical protein [Acidimicrobiales bacterium]
MRRVLVVLVLALTLAGCEASRLDRAAAVVVSGRVLRADGSPAAGVAVALLRAPSFGEVTTGLVFIPLTFGTACLADPQAALCRGHSVKRATTTVDGGYSFDLTGADTRTAFGHARSFTVTTGVAGATVTANFKIQTEDLRLPDLQAWQPAVTVGAGRIAWDPPAPGSYEVVFEDTAGRRVWTLGSPGTEVTFDPRILEDTAGRLAVAARSDASAEGTGVGIRRQSDQVAYRGAAGAPLSRGRRCTVEPAGTTLSPCPLTDGDLA